MTEDNGMDLYGNMTLDEMVDYCDSLGDDLGLDPVDVDTQYVDTACSLQETAEYIRRRMQTEERDELNKDDDYLAAVHYLEVHKATHLV